MKTLLPVNCHFAHFYAQAVVLVLNGSLHRTKLSTRLPTELVEFLT
jgi:hypothetical protein